jgi:hypothetical protein
MNIIKVFRKTEALRDGTFVAKVEIYSQLGVEAVFDEERFYASQGQAQARENELVENWKNDNAPPDTIIEFLN